MTLVEKFDKIESVVDKNYSGSLQSGRFNKNIASVAARKDYTHINSLPFAEIDHFDKTL